MDGWSGVSALEQARLRTSNPQAVSVETIAESQNFTLRVRVDPQDQGKLIGKNGRTARSLRVILQANATEQGGSYALDLSGGVPNSDEPGVPGREGVRSDM
jgi:predicted RNA-binding protein YlqC (UPF0109 family)